MRHKRCSENNGSPYQNAVASTVYLRSSVLSLPFYHFLIPPWESQSGRFSVFQTLWASLTSSKVCFRAILYKVANKSQSTTLTFLHHSQTRPIQTVHSLVSEGLSSLDISADTLNLLSFMEAIPGFSAHHALLSSAAGCSLNDYKLLELRKAGRVMMPGSIHASSSFFSCAFLFRTLDDQPLAAVLSGTRISQSFSSAPIWQGQIELRTSLPALSMPGEAALRSFLAFLTHGLFTIHEEPYGMCEVAVDSLITPSTMGGKLQAILSS